MVNHKSESRSNILLLVEREIQPATKECATLNLAVHEHKHEWRERRGHTLDQGLVPRMRGMQELVPVILLSLSSFAQASEQRHV